MINTGLAIYDLLSSYTGLTSLVGNNIFPLVISENTNFPAVVYERSYNNEYNKDSYTSISNFDITILSENYSETINIAVQVNNCLSGSVYNESGINIKSIKNIAGVETFNEGIFVQRLTYEVKSY